MTLFLSFSLLSIYPNPTIQAVSDTNLHCTQVNILKIKQKEITYIPTFEDLNKRKEANESIYLYYNINAAGEASESVEIKTVDTIERRFPVTKDIKNR